MTYRWGILSTGRIAGEFAEGLANAPGAELAAVGSRSRVSVDRFGDRFGIERRHESYEALAADPDVDVIYVATPHSRHCEDAVLALDNGKHVLCEKPFAMNASEAERMAAAARANDRFLMEAMWTRFNPVMVRLREILRTGVIGEPRMLLADFGFRTDVDPSGRLFDLSLGGGALLDVGVYCVSLSHLVFGGAPRQYTGTADLGATGVDEQSAWIGQWPNGALAIMSSAVRTDTPHLAVVCGSEGRVEIPDFWHPTELSIDGRREVFEIAGNGYHYQAIEVMRCLDEGLRESPALTLDMSLAVQRDLDRIRGQWGLRYPADS